MPEEMLGGDARGHLVGAPEPPLAVVAKAEGESVGELGGSAGRRGAGSVMQRTEAEQAGPSPGEFGGATRLRWLLGKRLPLVCFRSTAPPAMQ